jgi:rod shape-determining protein MreD
MESINPGLWQRLDHWARASAPSLSLALLVLLGVVPMQLPAYGAVAALLPLIGIYYWVLHRPELLPFPVIFLVGLAQDLLTAGHLGVNAFVFLAASWVALTQRKILAGMPVLIVWWGFAMIAMLAAGLEWVLMSALKGEIMALRPPAYRAMVTAAAYPIVALCLHPVLRTMTPARQGL